MGWHADDELGIGPVVASVSFGAPRRFLARRRQRNPGEGSIGWTLVGGDLLVMGPGMQSGWEHAVPKTRRPVGERISLFRVMRG